MKKMISLILVLAIALSMTACGAKEEAKTVDLNGLYESYSEYMPEMFYLDEGSLMNFLGIDVADCAQYTVAICAEGMRTDEVWLIEAKDQAAFDRLKALAETRIQSKLDETRDYVPDQYVIVEKAQLLTNGLYIGLLISPEVDALKAGFEAAFQ